MVECARKVTIIGFAGLQLAFSQIIRTSWQEWSFPESVNDPPVSPAFVTANRFGDLYVVDSDNNRILAFPGDGSPPKSAGGWGLARDRLSFPTDIAASPALDVLVCDNATHRILVFDRKLNFAGEKSLLDLVPQPVEYPHKIVQNSLGDLAVVSSGNWEVNLISASGTVTAAAANLTFGGGRLGEITDLSLGIRNEMAIVDISSGDLIVLTWAGKLKKRVPLPLEDMKLVQWWEDRWLVMGPSGELYELTTPGSDFKLIPPMVEEEASFSPRDFVVAGNTVYAASWKYNCLYKAELKSLDD